MCELRKQECDYFDTVINKSLLGMARIHNKLIVLEGCNAIVCKDYVNMMKKVKLISGGKAENELIYAGLVGPGMLTATVLGDKKSAPSVANILRVIEEIGHDNSSGILLIIQDYAEYSINFTLAKLYAEEKGYIVKLIIINNNSILNYYGDTTKEQDLLSLLFICKIAAAMSEEGRSIDEIYYHCNSIANSGEIIFLKTEFKNINQEEYKIEMLSNAAKQVLKPMIDILNTKLEDLSKTNIHKTKTFCAGHEIAILISNIGCSQIETNIFILELLQQIEIIGLKVKRIYMKNFMAHSNSSGFHICLLNLSFNTILIKYLDFPTFSFAWQKILTSKMLEHGEDDETQLITSGKYHKTIDWYDMNLQGPSMNYEIGQTFLSIISMACEAIIACIKQLDKIDQEYGNGAYGTSLAHGAKTIQNAIQENKILGTNLCVTFMQISHIIQETVDGLRGGLYSLFFYNIAKAFSEYQNDQEITVDMWLHVLISANKATEQIVVPSMGNQTLLTTLAAVQKELENALKQNIGPIDAFGVAVKAAENFTTNILYAQPSNIKKHREMKYPDPQAHAVGIWMRAAYEGTKLKLIYHNTK